MSDVRAVRIVLIGKTGVGKSSLGNTILNITRFRRRIGSVSVTRRCQMEQAVIADRRVIVVDTPDFFHSTHGEDLSSELDRSVELPSPEVHAFLFVLTPTTFTQQEAETVSKLKQTFGEEVFRHTIVLFTHGDEIPHEDMSRLIQQNESLKSLVNQCGGRFTVINNEAPSDREQVYYLLDIIDRMVSDQENSGYTLEMLQEARRRAKELRERSLEQQRREEESAGIKHQMDLERVRGETEIRVREELKARAANVEAAKCRREEENNMVDDVEQDSRKKSTDGKKTVKRQRRYFCVILSVFSLTLGCVFFRVSADRWAFLRGCGLGGSAAALGMMTGKLWVLILNSQLRTVHSSPQQSPNVLFQVLKRGVGVLCGGLVGAGVGCAGSDQTPVVLFSTLAGAVGAYTAMHRVH